MMTNFQEKYFDAINSLMSAQEENYKLKNELSCVKEPDGLREKLEKTQESLIESLDINSKLERKIAQLKKDFVSAQIDYKREIAGLKDKIHEFQQTFMEINRLNSELLTEGKCMLCARTCNCHLSLPKFKKLSTASTQSPAKVSPPSAAKVSAQSVSKISTPSGAKVPAQSAAKVSPPSAAKVSAQSVSKISTPSAPKVSTPSGAKVPAQSAAKVSPPSVYKVSTHSAAISSTESPRTTPTEPAANVSTKESPPSPDIDISLESIIAPKKEKLKSISKLISWRAVVKESRPKGTLTFLPKKTTIMIEDGIMNDFLVNRVEKELLGDCKVEEGNKSVPGIPESLVEEFDPWLDYILDAQSQEKKDDNLESWMDIVSKELGSEVLVNIMADMEYHHRVTKAVRFYLKKFAPSVKIPFESCFVRKLGDTENVPAIPKSLKSAFLEWFNGQLNFAFYSVGGDGKKRKAESVFVESSDED